MVHSDDAVQASTFVSRLQLLFPPLVRTEQIGSSAPVQANFVQIVFDVQIACEVSIGKAGMTEDVDGAVSAAATGASPLMNRRNLMPGSRVASTTAASSCPCEEKSIDALHTGLS
jgi:hypothetical protein